jgi:hypothetical protein
MSRNLGNGDWGEDGQSIDKAKLLHDRMVRREHHTSTSDGGQSFDRRIAEPCVNSSSRIYIYTGVFPNFIHSSLTIQLRCQNA